MKQPHHTHTLVYRVEYRMAGYWHVWCTVSFQSLAEEITQRITTRDGVPMRIVPFVEIKP